MHDRVVRASRAPLSAARPGLVVFRFVTLCGIAELGIALIPCGD
jgi:hypothetical protein